MTSPFDPDLLARAAALIPAYAARGWMIATAESCTGGLVAALLTEIAGSSAVVDRGFITYSNEAKISMLGVNADIIETTETEYNSYIEYAREMTEMLFPVGIIL